MDAFLVSTGIIFAAELGDKSQLLALTLASRHRTAPVLAGLAVAAAALFALSVTVGRVLGDTLPLDVLAVAGGLAFLGFAVWTLRDDDEEDATSADAGGRGFASAFAATTVAFVLAELGDKTMLASAALATTRDAVGVWAGSTVGMVVADVLAIAAGRLLGRRLPRRALRIGAAVLFAGFGVLLLVQAI